MGLEAVMICIDNSEYSRNGDYIPSRFDQQTETANLLGGSKTGQHPETGVGLLTLAGERIEVHLTPTTEFGAFVAALSEMQIRGKADVVRGIQCATLALKHRQNKNQKQRIICFVGSPVEATEKQLEQLGKTLKKNNVSLDVVSFGEVADNKAKLEKLVSACNSNDTSHFVEIPSGPRILSDVVLTSAIGFGEGGEGGAGGAAGGDGFEFGVDPTADPELALALRISMEEEKRRQDATTGGDAASKPAEGGEAPAADGAQPTGGASSSADGGGQSSTPAADSLEAQIPGYADMDPELQEALKLSLLEGGSESAAADPVVQGSSEPSGKKQKVESSKEEPPAEASLFEDPDFVASMLGSLPGVDMNDPKIQEAIQGAKKDGDKKKEDKKDDKK